MNNSSTCTDDTVLAPTVTNSDRLRQLYSMNSNGSNILNEAQPMSPSNMEPPPGQTSDSMRRASILMLDLGEKRSRRSMVDVRESMEFAPLLQQQHSDSSGENHHHRHYASIQEEDEARESESFRRGAASRGRRRKKKESECLRGSSQIPAVALACLMNLMVGVPFGVSYFPIGWSAAGAADLGGAGGPFPVPDRVALGIRMFLFSTVMGQIAFTATSKFTNPIALQMVENVPFFHALASIVIEEQGYGRDALSTLFFLYGASSVLVGALFYMLGKLKYGRIVYFFPSHVLVGCIGGIGVFILVTSVEVTLNVTFDLTSLESWKSAWDQMDLFGIVLAFEIVLKVLDHVTHDEQGRPRFPLLAPIYFCLITPLFYLGLKVFSISMGEAEDAGYFFPSAAAGCNENNVTCGSSGEISGIFQDNLLEIFQIIDFTTISWTAVVKSFPTMVALAAFSLIHVPINIPAFGISTDVDTDMNAELIAHGWSNFCSGIFGGLQNYMTYSNSVLYAKSGGQGKISSLCVAFFTAVLFVVGPQIVSFIPRCMAGTLLFHIGIDLFLEGVLDSYSNYDNIEYCFVWVIAIVMTVYGMTAALIASIVAAMSTYAAQSIAHHNPIRGIVTASTLRSSAWNRGNDALRILDDPQRGRSRILILQLQGHLFFGTCAQITDTMKAILNEKKGTPEEPWVVIMDFTLVIGMDSSAAHAIAKLKKVMHKVYRVEVTIFVTGSGEGFPCEYALSHELSKAGDEGDMVDWNDLNDGTAVYRKLEERPMISRGSISLSIGSPSLNASLDAAKHPKERVCESLDYALIFAENILVSRANEGLLRRDQVAIDSVCDDPDEMMSLEEEKHYALKYLTNLCPNTTEADIKRLFSCFQREEYKENDTIWKQRAFSTSAKILVHGTFMSYLEGTKTTESVSKGNMLGELGLVQGIDRLSTVICISEKAITYSLSKEAWYALVEEEPRVARLMDSIVIRYLAHRVQHVSNRIFETRCLPI